tara:strand:+ start:3758 stop:4831 length:1074 start_codon:yes stop_codon:yes gene_type:complete
MSKKSLSIFYIYYGPPFPFSVNGAAIFDLDLLSYLSTQNHTLHCITCIFDNSKEKAFNELKKMQNKFDFTLDFNENQLTITFKSVTFHIYDNKEFFQACDTYVRTHTPSIIWHRYSEAWIQKADWSLFASQTNILFFTEHIASLNHDHLIPFNKLILNSQYLKKAMFPKKRNLPAVIHPVPDESCRNIKHPFNPQFILFFNPNIRKGSDIVFKLAKQNPHLQFMIVKGWWGYIDQPFETLNNVLIVPPQEDVSEIYSYSKLLLFPSQAIESFGRIQIEAAYNNIPMLGSKNGGIEEIFNGNGLLVDDITSIDEWQRKLDALLEPTCYNRCVNRCKTIQKKYSLKMETKKFETILLNL